MCFQYAEDYDLDEEQKEDLWFHISAMDRDFLAWWIKKQPKPRQPRGTKGKGSGRSRGVRQTDEEAG